MLEHTVVADDSAAGSPFRLPECFVEVAVAAVVVEALDATGEGWHPRFHPKLVQSILAEKAMQCIVRTSGWDWSWSRCHCWGLSQRRLAGQHQLSEYWLVVFH